MTLWIDRLLLLGLLVIVVASVATAYPVFLGDHLSGKLLFAHMMASGGLVFALPVLGLWWIFRCNNPAASTRTQRLGYWLMLLTGLLTIVSMFLCMLPIPSTEQMEQLITLHGYAGLAMVPALVVLVIGFLRWRRIQLTRSATPG